MSERMTAKQREDEALKTARGIVGPLALIAPMTLRVMDTAIEAVADAIRAGEARGYARALEVGRWSGEPTEAE